MIARDDRGNLCVSGVAAAELVERFGSPLYAYSADVIRQRYRRLRKAFGALLDDVHYSVKALSNLSILRLLDEEGAGFDVVSGGEIARCLEVGVDPARIVFAGVGKTDAELRGALEAGVGTFNVESRSEWESLRALAVSTGRTARVALRVNPDVDAGTHRYITTGRGHNKFGMDLETAWSILEAGVEPLRFQGFHLHIGSQITRPEPLVELAEVAVQLAEAARRRGSPVAGMNLGGGLGVGYREPGLDLESAVAALRPTLERLGVPISLEPGRFLVAEAGVLLTRVVRIKEGDRRFVIVDAGMNDLLRPALYQAEHVIDTVRSVSGEHRLSDVVGPICESADFFALDLPLEPVVCGDLLAVRTAGAYGFSMASQYNSRLRPAEVLVEGAEARCIRRREEPEDLWRLELSDGL